MRGRKKNAMLIECCLCGEMKAARDVLCFSVSTVQQSGYAEWDLEICSQCLAKPATEVLGYCGGLLDEPKGKEK